jgi:hypothetical protein
LIDVILWNLSEDTRKNHGKSQPVFSRDCNRKIYEYVPRNLELFQFHLIFLFIHWNGVQTLLLTAKLRSPIVYISDSHYVTYNLLA